MTLEAEKPTEGTGPEPSLSRDLAIEELRLEHEATWKTLDAANGQRDLVARFNGALIVFIGVLVPVLLSNLGIEESVVAVVLILNIAVGFLVFLTYFVLLGAQQLRMLQIMQDASCHFSRVVLAGGPGKTFFVRDSSKVYQLKDQRDPMGLAVTMTRHFFFADVFAEATLVSITVIGLILYWSRGFSSLRPVAPWAPLSSLAASLVLAAVTTRFVQKWIDKKIGINECKTQNSIEERFRALHYPAAPVTPEDRQRCAKLGVTI